MPVFRDLDKALHRTRQSIAKENSKMSWLQPPSQDEPESTQVNQGPDLGQIDPELERLLAEEEDIERQSQISDTRGSDSDLAEAGAESAGPYEMQKIMNILSEYLHRYGGSDRAGFYNALRVVAQTTGTHLPVRVLYDFPITSPATLIARVRDLDDNYRRSHAGRSISVFGPVAWDRANLLHCELADGTQFLCFDYPSRDPASDR